MENTRKREVMELVCNERRQKKQIAEPSFNKAAFENAQLYIWKQDYQESLRCTEDKHEEKITFHDYKRVLKQQSSVRVTMNNIRPYHHEVYNQCMNKVALIWSDDKRQILDSGILTETYGYKN
ncbi:hypothetical protein PR048_005364 [Dryococelus australis]|uniref:Uncharacterized protein n=1 Tax=Dryococelus australis TaxID=614101 RepID=A0ABQ9I801_9NEOP|nr:hypothetical protein PR048_005364 [Dryococelus australis]